MSHREKNIYCYMIYDSLHRSYQLIQGTIRQMSLCKIFLMHHRNLIEMSSVKYWNTSVTIYPFYDPFHCHKTHMSLKTRDPSQQRKHLQNDFQSPS